MFANTNTKERTDTKPFQHKRRFILVNIKTIKSVSIDDPIEQTIEDIIDEFGDHSNTEEEEEEEEEGEEETSDSREQRIREEEEERQLAKNKSYLQKSKDWVKQYFINTGLSAKSTSTLLKYFNTYVEAKDAFPDCHCFTEIGISWIQLEDSERPYAPLAKLAQRLHASPCSEASCERTISKQRLIYTARRKRSNRDLLDARLTILNATFNGNEKSDYLKQKIIRKQAKVHQLQLDADEEDGKQEKEEKEDE